MSKLFPKFAAWLILALGIWNTLRIISQSRTSVGLIAATVNLFVAAGGFLFLKRLGGPGFDQEVVPEATGSAGGMQLDGIIRFRRITVVPSENGVALKIPSTFESSVLGLLFAALPLASLLGIPTFISRYSEIQASGRAGMRVAALILGLSLMVVIYPWWWFLGGEEIELTSSALRYRAGLRPFRRLSSYSWPLIENVRLTTPRLMGVGYQILFGYKPELGMVHGIGRHLRTEEAMELIALLKTYQRLVAEANANQASQVFTPGGK